MMLVACLTLSACLSEGRGDSRLTLAPPPPAFTPTDNVSDRAPDQITIKIDRAAVLSENQALASLTTDPPVPEGCRLKDRFDRSSFLSFSSDSGAHKLALNLDTGGVNVKGLELRYTLKLHPSKHKAGKESCLYPGQFQGLAPSAYRELVKRRSNTVWQHLRALKNELAE